MTHQFHTTDSDSYCDNLNGSVFNFKLDQLVAFIEQQLVYCIYVIYTIFDYFE